MTSVAVMIALIVAGSFGVTAKTTIDPSASQYPPRSGDMCFLTGAPPADVKYEVLGRIVATKRTYGGVDELYSPMAAEALLLGADAIINLEAGQRFKGPMPWRVNAPTGDGRAIKVLPDSPRIDCLNVGGKLLGANGFVTRAESEGAVKQEVDRPGESAEPERTTSKRESQKIDLYKEILKLDDLRNRGLLTDAEFEAEKKKLLERN